MKLAKILQEEGLIKTAAYPTYDIEGDEMLLRGWDEVGGSEETPAYLKGGVLIIQDIMGFEPRVFEYSERVRNSREAAKIVDQALKDAGWEVDSLDDSLWEEQ